MAKQQYFWIGVFVTAITIIPIAIGIWGASENLIRDLAVSAFAVIAALSIFLITILFFREKIMSRLMSSAENNLTDVSATAFRAISAASKGDTEAASTETANLVKSGLTWYTWTGFYRWVMELPSRYW